MEAKHTPWEACERGDYTDDGIVILDVDMTRRIAIFNREDDAARAVHAVNCHDELVAALGKLRKGLDLIDPARPLQYADAMDLMRKCADSAIAKAKPLATDDTSCNKPTGEVVAESDIPY